MNLNAWIAREEYGGWLHIYALILTVGFLLAFGLVTWRFYKRRLPWRSLEWGLFIVLPCGVLGASFFGKLDIKHPIPFYELFAFWQPGLSIHGSLLVGSLVGLIFFVFQSRKYQISTWIYADAIFPSVLVGQAIGRWGNFFNHELLGLPTNDPLKWLPSFIRDNLFKWYIPHPVPNNFLPTMAQGVNGQAVNPNNFSAVQYYQPLFLYESFADILLLLVIIWVIPLIFKIINYYKLKRSSIIKSSLVHFKSLYQTWYYAVVVKVKTVENLKIDYDLVKNDRIFRKKIAGRSLRVMSIHRTIYAWQTLKLLWKRNSQPLNELHNPHHLIILRCGVAAGLYWFGYNLIRFILELQRTDQDLFIHNIRWLDYTLLIFFSLSGLLGIFFVQFISPKKWRNSFWLYEKQY